MCIHTRRMLPSSHQSPIDAAPQTQGLLLAEAFSEFISASARLELSYRDLQAEVAELTSSLNERNLALSESLTENKNMGLTLERILDAMPCGVLVVNSEGQVRLVNPEAARLLALPSADMRTLSSIQANTGLDLMLGLEGTEDSEAEQELSFESSAGRRWIAMRQVCLPSVQGAAGTRRPAETVLTLRDISARKRMDREREAARDAVALAQVSALLAHEIRNPLASLELFAGLIADNPERRDEWISHLRAGIRSLSGTVNNVLTLHGETAAPMETIEIVHEAGAAVSFLQPLAAQKGVNLCLQPPPAPLLIRANRSAFHQLLLNLCSNALRHTAAGGTVSLGCHPPEGGSRPFRVTVSDNGSGIPKEQLRRIFEGGFSGSGHTPGLGLAVCERLMRQHGGTVCVESRVGHGSTFTLEFPQS